MGHMKDGEPLYVHSMSISITVFPSRASEGALVMAVIRGGTYVQYALSVHHV